MRGTRAIVGVPSLLCSFPSVVVGLPWSDGPGCEMAQVLRADAGRGDENSPGAMLAPIESELKNIGQRLMPVGRRVLIGSMREHGYAVCR